MTEPQLPQPIVQTLEQIDRLSHFEHFLVIVISQTTPLLVIALINYFGFTKNKNVKSYTLFQAFINLVWSIMIRTTKGKIMPEFLEGPEYSHKIGEIGQAVVDVTPDLKLNVSIGVQIDIMAELKKLAAKTQTKLDDDFLSIVEGILTKSAQMDAKAVATLSAPEAPESEQV